MTDLSTVKTTSAEDADDEETQIPRKFTNTAKLQRLGSERLDVENLSYLQNKVYNMTEDEWNDIEEKIDEHFTDRVLGLMWWRYCFKCNFVRPPRSHHCSVCDSCVMRMDHHCPWVGNCVGINNHKLFWNFLFNAFMGCLIVAVTMVRAAFQMSFTKFNKEVNYQAVMMVACALILSLGVLFGMHTYLIATNTSTLEMDALYAGNPFNRKKRVLKSSAER